MIIRRATPEDAAGIAAVQVATWQTAYAGILDQTYLDAMDVETKAEQTEAFIRGNQDYRMVAVVNGEIAGYSIAAWNTTEPFADEWYLRSLHVHPRHQGSGLGRALLDDVKSEGKARGANHLYFDVLSLNAPAIGFYERQGATFVQVGIFTLEGVDYPTDHYVFTL